MPIAPDLDLTSVGGRGYLAADRCRGFFFATFVSAQRTVDVVEANGPGLKSVVLEIVLAQFFHEELLPAIPLLRVGWKSVFLPKRSDLGALLQVLGVDAGGRGEEEAVCTVETGCLQHMHVGHGIVASDLSVEGGYVPDSPHVCRQMVDLVDSLGRDQAIVETPEDQGL